MSVEKYSRIVSQHIPHLAVACYVLNLLKLNAAVLSVEGWDDLFDVDLKRKNSTIKWEHLALLHCSGMWTTVTGIPAMNCTTLQ